MLLNPYRFGGGGGPAAPLLDSYTSNMWSCGGFRKLLTSYSDNLIRVRRSSDNAEMDVGQAGDGSLNTAAMLSWSGSDSVFLVTVYDQSGTANHFGQVTASMQPRIANAGVYDGFFRFDGSDDSLTSVNQTPANAALSWALRYALRAAAAGGTTQTIMSQWLGVSGHNTSGFQQQSNNGSYMAYIFEGASTFRDRRFDAVNTNENTDLMVFNRPDSLLYRNGASVSPTATGGGSPGGSHTLENLYIGGITNLQPAVMNMKWYAVWSNDQSSNGNGISSVT